MGTTLYYRAKAFEYIQSWWLSGLSANHQLSRRSTTRESSTRLVPVGPTEVKARKSVIFTEGSHEVKSKEHLLDSVNTHFIVGD